ncbi:Exoglucanase 1 [Tulasnella sp. 419]|nr:Exoglucanase 1 [Tulasnella sp. 418]KAG8957198.1 Exoglucanase 1 [Tulasnella sp. 419]
MFRPTALVSLTALASAVYAQQVGTQKAEVHPPLTWQTCTSSGCTNVNGQVVLDANWRWLHTTTGYTNCYTGNAWDTSLCPDGKTCAQNCALDGADYSATYGITTSGNSLRLNFKTGSNVGSRVYLMANESKYQMFKLNNKEFTFDVEVSSLGCGLNGALYFSEMAEDGGMAQFPTNKAGAKYGTGYCDAQCPKDIKFINGEANVDGWTGTSTNTGKGKYGTCCQEMDIWEANSISNAYTPHPCDTTGLYRCEGATCDVCDQPGCDFNPYRMGDRTFYGPGSNFKLDTTKKITVVTQFLTDTGTASGKLKEIRRVWVQNGVVIQNTKTNIANLDPYDSITEQFCTDQKAAFSDTNVFAQKGGMVKMGEAFNRGVVLAMSIWDDYTANMLWLDSNYPLDRDASQPGVARGTCPTTSGVPADVESQQANSYVVFSNIKFGDIGTTFSGSTSQTTTTRPNTTVRTTTTTRPASSSTRSSSVPRTTTTTANPATQTKWGQCGGNGWTGPTQCVSGSTCTRLSDWYYQCI